MDSSSRAVESYWRSRMIDAATSDEEKVTPVYKLEEVSELLRSSQMSIVKEVSEFILKRLEHKSPIVKQKALRLIKYAVGKSGTEFRREMQKKSVAVRQLLDYKGHPDLLKGEALNKAVQDTAQEALSAIFSADDNKPQPGKDLNKRIQGFGNANYQMPYEDKKSFLSEVVCIGSATIKQGFRLSSLSQAQSLKKNDTGNYKSPNLQQSLTTEVDHPDRYDRGDHRNETQGTSRMSNNGSSGPWGQDLNVTPSGTGNGNSTSSYAETKTREERLLETIVTSGGVRLQPTRDALQVFLVESSKLDALAVSHALESKLQSPLWQVRMKAVCVLEAILRKKDDEHFSTVASYFSEIKDVVMKCSESPQASLREKATKVLSLLDGDQTDSGAGHPQRPVKGNAVVEVPDLMDAGDHDDLYGTDDTTKVQSDQSIANPMTTSSDLVNNFLGDGLGSSVSTGEQKNDDDPFADVSFHAVSGMGLEKPGASEVRTVTNKNGPELFDVFGSTPELPQEQENPRKVVNDFMAGVTINEKASIVSNSIINASFEVPNDALNGILGSQAVGPNANSMSPLVPVPDNLPSGIIFNPAFHSQPLDYGAMGSLFAQQQFLATISNFQQFGNLQAQNATVTKGEGYSSPLPDIFNPTILVQTPSSVVNSSENKESNAFDFILDHLAAAWDPKRVV